VSLGDDQPPPSSDPSPFNPQPKSQHPSVSSTDLSSLAHLLQSRFDEEGSSESIRPGIIRVSSLWERLHQDNLLSASRLSPFDLEDQRSAKQRALDLLDALTRSGGLTVEGASVHVLLTSAHHFDQSLLETVIQRNDNPLLKLEKTLLLMASVIHDRAVDELLEA
jgi:hypothetical protein